jgi:hypothetical protein
MPRDGNSLTLAATSFAPYARPVATIRFQDGPDVPLRVPSVGTVAAAIGNIYERAAA